MPSVRVLDERGGGEARKYHLWGCVGKCDLFVWKIEKGNNSTFYMITGESSLESMVEEETLRTFKDEGFEIVPPPEVKAARTVVIKQIDPIYREATDIDFMAGISLINCRANILETTIIPTPYETPMVKVRFSKVYMAEHALNNGLKVFEQTIPPKALQREVCVRLETCTNCFGYSHIKPNCPKPLISRCTNCAREGHKHFNCPGGEFKCLNCNEQHSTFSRDCRTRKTLMKQKTKEEIKRESNKAKTRQRDHEEKQKSKLRGWNEKEITQLPADVFAVVITALISATMIETKMRGTFQSNYNDVLDHHAIPRVTLPQHIIGQLVRSQDQTQQRPEVDNYSESIRSAPSFPNLDMLTTGTEGETEMSQEEQLEHEPIIADPSVRRKKKKCNKRRKTHGTPKDDFNVQQHFQLSRRAVSGLSLPMDSEIEVNVGGAEGGVECKLPQNTEEIAKTPTSENLTPTNQPRSFTTETPPPVDALHFTKADTTIIQEDHPIAELQRAKAIIFYPITWKLDSYHIMMKFLDRETYAHLRGDDKRSSLRQLIRKCLANDGRPDTVINFAGVEKSVWQSSMNLVYGDKNGRM